MDAYYLGRPNSSMGIFQINLIEQFARNRSIDELHILSATEADIYLKYDNCHYHISGDSLIMRGVIWQSSMRM